jgi:hypothetical protein
MAIVVLLLWREMGEGASQEQPVVLSLTYIGSHKGSAQALMAFSLACTAREKQVQTPVEKDYVRSCKDTLPSIYSLAHDSW